jgi:hypothetical protein
MTKIELIANIQNAFKNIKLEDGVGLWEAQGIDDYADEKTMAELKKKDERNDWDKIPYKDLAFCYSSLSFFDAKGMRFCLPKFLIFDLLADEINEKEGLNSPDMLFTLGHKLNEDYQKNRFSLLDLNQIQCIINYLYYKLPFEYDEFGLNKTIAAWTQKLNEQ